MITEAQINAGARALVRYTLGLFEDQSTDKDGKRNYPAYFPNVRARQAALDVLQAAERAALNLAKWPEE